MSYQDEEEQAAGPIDELAEASPPNDLRNIRACKRCGILKTTEQFYEQGCENCPFLDMPEDMRMVNNFTTAFFEGHVAVMDPRESWAAKWIRVDAYLPGVYAITVTGQFDSETQERLENQGIRWRCRPATQQS